MNQKAFQKGQSIVREFIYSMGDRLSTIVLRSMVAHYTSVINKMCIYGAAYFPLAKCYVYGSSTWSLLHLSVREYVEEWRSTTHVEDV